MPDVNDSILQRVFGDKPFIKIVDTLLDHPEYEYTKTELAEVNEMGRSTLYRVWNRVEDLVSYSKTQFEKSNPIWYFF